MVKSTSTNNSVNTAEFTDNLERREAIGKVFEYLFLIGLLIGLFVLALLVLNILHDGLGRLLTPGFLTETPSRFAERGVSVQPLLGVSFWD